MTARAVALAAFALASACWIAGVVAWATSGEPAWEGEDVPSTVAALTIVAGGGALLVVLGVIVVRAALRLRGRVGRVRPGSTALALAVAAGLAAGTPVHHAWDDGCNVHDARLPLIAAPYAVLATPENPHLAYGDFRTDALCAGVFGLKPGPRS